MAKREKKPLSNQRKVASLLFFVGAVFAFTGVDIVVAVLVGVAGAVFLILDKRD